MCEYCEIEYDNTKGGWLGDGWTILYIGINSDNRIFIRACGDEYTDDYYPKFCPECGRELNNE